MKNSPWSQANQRRKRWGFLLPLAVAMVFCAEILFMSRLDMAKNADVVENWTTSFFRPRSLDGDVSVDVVRDVVVGGRTGEEEVSACEEWLEKEDAVPYARDFDKEPVLVTGKPKDFSSCSVPCEFGHSSNRKADATFGYGLEGDVPSILRSMESSHYYSENDPDVARRKGFGVVMTTSLSSDVPVGYFSWAEYDIMAPVQPKTEEALAAAFISNCGARNFRLQALEMLEQSGIKIDSYGGCHNNRNGNVDKVETLKRYKFSLAFENSNEEDYVTEKFFQSLVAGNIPVVVGAPNILEFAPSPGSVLHIKESKDVESVAATMKHLAANPDAFNQTLRWKYEGPSDSFKALVDMAAVHSSCRLCIFIATNIHKKEEANEKFHKRPCSCSSNSETTYHLFVRERGRFKTESIFLRSGNLTLKALELAVLEKFKSLNHVPVWKNERPPSLRGSTELKVHKIYPVGLTQRQGLYNFRFKDDLEFEKYIKENPCAKLEVVFV
ncbi:3-alpha-L-fucosyltransferase [Rhynchospora pubera]|uniref:Fucosyltransferase n=2 Tax=Rhynchospora pubera TaxID=906938 RepID=A0AAV8BPZ7_9POAL|nr:3-alpha-L-fucosyltransferase [Rhynchospora pubera]